MRTNRHNIHICAWAVAAVVALASCDYKDIGPGHETVQRGQPVELRFDFSRVDSVPASYSIMFYPAGDKARSFRRDVTASDQTILLPVGDYAVTAWNNDTPHVLVEEQDDRDRVSATTFGLETRTEISAESVLDSIFGGQKLYDWPDYLTKANVEEFAVDEDTEVQPVLTLTPDSATVTVHYRIGGVKGLGWCYRVKGAQNNVWGRRFLAYEEKGSDAVSVMFESGYDEKEETVFGEYQIFGLADGGQAMQDRDRLVLFFWLQNGNGGYVPIDITRALAPYRNRTVRHIYIDIPDLDVNLIDFLDGDDAFNIDINEWQNVNIDIRI